MDINTAVEFYHSLLRFGVQPGLERMTVLLDKLGNPQENMKIIHVAGTNGKGSVCNMLSRILTCSGYKTGMFVSPYVVCFNERMQIDSEMISDYSLCAVTDKVYSAVAELNSRGIYPTEFEAVTAAGFVWFSESGCDAVVLEVGLGGRFDATNIIKQPVASVITSISLDHVGILGDTVEKIAFEKCGIVKPGCPVITNSSQLPGVTAVIKSAAEKNNSPLVIADTESVLIHGGDIFGSDVEYSGVIIHVPFPGRVQIENAVTALEAARAVRSEFPRITDNNIQTGISSALNPARCEVISRSPLVILDGCHNDGSTAALAGVLKQFLPGKRLLGLCGMMKDKDINKSLDNLLGLFSGLITSTPSNPRALPAAELKLTASEWVKEVKSIDDPLTAAEVAEKELSGYDALVVFGSLYLAGDIRKRLYELFKR